MNHSTREDIANTRYLSTIQRRRQLKKMLQMIDILIESHGHPSDTMIKTKAKIEVELLYLKLDLNTYY